MPSMARRWGDHRHHLLQRQAERQHAPSSPSEGELLLAGEGWALVVGAPGVPGGCGTGCCSRACRRRAYPARCPRRAPRAMRKLKWEPCPTSTFRPRASASRTTGCSGPAVDEAAGMPGERMARMSPGRSISSTAGGWLGSTRWAAASRQRPELAEMDVERRSASRAISAAIHTSMPQRAKPPTRHGP